MVQSAQKNLFGLSPHDLLKRTQVGEGDRVADLGCGSHAALVFETAKFVGEQGRVYAVDIQKSVLDAVASKRKVWPSTGQIELVWSNLEKLGATSIPPASLEVAFLCNVLNQSKEQVAILKESTRLLGSGGRLLVVDWETLDAVHAPQGCCPVDPQWLEDTVSALGFEVADRFTTSDHHFGRLFIKH